MGWQPGPRGGTGASPDRGPGVPGLSPVRDPRLAEFASDGGRDVPVPSGRLALIADEVSGRDRRCPGATDDELVGLLRAWTAVESWAAGAKLGVITEMIRRDGAAPQEGRHADLPDQWSPSLRHELAAALACSVQSAETTVWLAWEQQARLRGIGALLADGTLTFGKARAVIETFKYLTDGDAARAEALIMDRLAGKTYTQALRLAEQAALAVDPELAGRRREQAQRRDARVTCFRELSGTAGLSGRDLPPDEALAAMASVNARAKHYEDCGAFGDTRMDVLRAYAYLDLLNGVPPEARIACAEAQDEAAEVAEALAWAEAREARSAAEARAGRENEPEPGRNANEGARRDQGGSRNADNGARRDQSGNGGGPSPDRPGSEGRGSEGRGSGGPRAGGSAASGPGDGLGTPPAGPGMPSTARAPELRPPDLVVPLTTLLGRAERSGEIQGFGLLDPMLARKLAAAAIASPYTEVCVTVTSAEGYAIGHGCARSDRSPRSSQATGPPGTSQVGFPARLNLTISAAALAGLTGHTRHAGPWGLASRGGAGPPDGTAVKNGAVSTDKASPSDGYGTWTLAVPGGRRFTVRLDPVPTFDCDHRYESQGYQPSDKLRHLVQVRDGTCTFPSCSRHARESDFEHARPYDKGGRTCACNAGARSRACHRVKQSPGWQVTQPRPGWHQWTTPAGRSYLQEPKRYPV
jgi:hypothetical protein